MHSDPPWLSQSCQPWGAVWFMRELSRRQRPTPRQLWRCNPSRNRSWWPPPSRFTSATPHRPRREATSFNDQQPAPVMSGSEVITVGRVMGTGGVPATGSLLAAARFGSPRATPPNVRFMCEVTGFTVAHSTALRRPESSSEIQHPCRASSSDRPDARVSSSAPPRIPAAAASSSVPAELNSPPPISRAPDSNRGVDRPPRGLQRWSHGHAMHHVRQAGTDRAEALVIPLLYRTVQDGRPCELAGRRLSPPSTG